MIESWKSVGRQFGAPQVAVVPPFCPLQVHDHGPVPLTIEGVPTLQSPTVGITVVTTPFAGPQTPFTGVGFALQLAVVPPFDPAHDHVHGPVPDTVEGAPTLQSPVEGFEATVVPLVGPQTPLTGAGV